MGYCAIYYLCAFNFRCLYQIRESWAFLYLFNRTFNTSFNFKKLNWWSFRFSQALTQKSNWSFSIPRAQLQITTNVITSKRCALKILTKTVSLSSETAPTYRGNNIIRSSSRLLLSESGDPLYSLGSDLKVHEEGQKIPTNWKRFRHKLFNLIPV